MTRTRKFEKKTNIHFKNRKKKNKMVTKVTLTQC